MTVVPPAATPAPGAAPVGPDHRAVIDGVDVDAVAAAVRGCPAVADLDGGQPVQSVVTYLPGRRVAGVRVADHRVTVQVVLRWGASVADLARQVRSAVKVLTGSRPIDIAVAAVTDPPGAPSAPERSTADQPVAAAPTASAGPSTTSSTGARPVELPGVDSPRTVGSRMVPVQQTAAVAALPVPEGTPSDPSVPPEDQHVDDR